MDVRTALMMVTAMALLNGAVLGFLHKTLAEDLQPSAQDWRIGTLLVAAGPILLSVQDHGPPWLLLPLGNGLIFFGLTLYWRALRRINNMPDRYWLFAPAALGTLLLYVFSHPLPELSLRLISGSIAVAFITAMGAYTLARRERDASENALMMVLALITAFMLFRAFFYAVVESAPMLLKQQGAMPMVTGLLFGSLPVIGTTLFLAMCVERMRRRMEVTAATDYLTGLPNRRTISTTGTARFNAARRVGAGVAVALVDVDHFKSINDRFGHSTGDAALCHVANLLASHCRGLNMVGRLGGEEFLAIFEDANAADAKIAAERLRAAIESTPFTAGGQTIAITASLGVAAIEESDERFDHMLDRADKALYAAKAGGRNRVAS
jgi:diguanylate cyclase (GGDEF)-like protein